MRYSKVALVLMAFVSVVAVGIVPAHAQVASAVIREGDPNVVPGFGPVGSIDGPEVNGIGGWGLMFTATDPNSVARDMVWGSVDGIVTPSVYFMEGTYAGITQTSWEFAFGLSDTGDVGYSASGTDPNAQSIDSVFINSSLVAVRYTSPPPPLDSLFWSFASAPGLTAGGDFWFIGGLNEAPSSSSTNRGLFDGSGQAHWIGGDELPGMPAFIDPGTTPSFDTRFSPYSGLYISEVEAETTGTGVPSTANNCLIMNDAVAVIGGGLVIEASPVPASAGGLAGENWDNFDYFSINDMGEYIFTGDTDASTSADEIVVVSGQIAMREGDLAGVVPVSGSIEMAAMNQSGDWAVVWDVNDPNAGNVEALIVNGDLVLTEAVDDIDIDGDGTPEPGARISGTSAFAGTRALRVANRDPNGVFNVWVVGDVSDNGATEAEMLLKLEIQGPAGTDGDLQLVVADSPDPLVTLPGKITYNVSVRNNGGTPLTGVSVVSTLDNALVFDGANSDPIAVHSGDPTGGTVTAAIGNLAAYGVTSYKFVVDAANPGDVTTTSVASANEADPIPGNNNATNDTSVGSSTDLSIELADSPDPIYDPNGIVTYTVTVTNGGPSDATGVVATVTLDANTSFISSTLATHDGAPTGGVATANIGAMADGANVVFDVVAQVLSQSSVTLNGEVTGTEDDPLLDNNTASEETLFELTADLEVGLTDAPDPVLPVGGQITYTVDVINNGPSPATGVNLDVTLDANTAYVSNTGGASHDGSPTGGGVSLAIGAMAIDGIVSFQIIVDTLVEGTVIAAGTVTGSGTEVDPDAANNAGSTSTAVVNDLGGFAVGLYSNIAGHPTNTVPGVPGVSWQNFDRPYRSPNTRLWILSADTDEGTSADEYIIVGSQCGGSLFAQEGVTTLDPNVIGDQIGFIDQKLSINDAGDFAFTTNTNGATSADEVVVKYEAAGDKYVTIAREGDAAAPTGGNYGSVLGSANITNTGFVWFIGDTDLSTAIDYFVFEKNGNSVVLQEGVDIPSGSLGVDPNEAWDNFDSTDLSVDATGATYAVEGDLEGDTSTDKIFAVNNDVKTQEGIVIPGSGFTSPADALSPNDYGRIFSDGTWMVRGGNDDNQDWVVRDGAVLAKTGDPIALGNPELYDDAPFSVTFFLFAANNNGHYIIGGTTNASNDASNAVLVLDGKTVISREDDVIDLNGNGLLDDPTRIRTYGNDDLILTDDMQAYVVVTMRDINDDGSNTDVGDAFIRFNLCGVATSFCADLNADGLVDATDYDIFRAAFGRTSCETEYHACADYDGDGTVTFLDYREWVRCYREALPATQLNKDGSATTGTARQ